MSWSVKKFFVPHAKTTIFWSVVFLFATSAANAPAQKKFSRSFAAGQNVRLQLLNRTGTVAVEGWNRSEISISASMETPAANIVPQTQNGTLVINLVRDNQGREIGTVNFTIRVPFSTIVDIETMIGNLTVSNIQSGLVRAHISSDGDITLMNIVSAAVSAENGIGDIFFDGQIQNGGNYRFSSRQGTISLRIPFNASFSLVATAPSTRNISLGPFANSNMNYVGTGRRVVGQFGDGSATLTVTNQRGNISFLRR